MFTFFHVRQFAQQQDEFIAAQASHGVASPHAMLQAASRLDQHHIALAMPVGVVDGFEVVRVR